MDTVGGVLNQERVKSYIFT